MGDIAQGATGNATNPRFTISARSAGEIDIDPEKWTYSLTNVPIRFQASPRAL
jgi:hypothetical protein